jgi:hypothetical protein
MKKSRTLLFVAGIVVALIIGFVVGISVDYPKVDTEEVTGTVRKVDNYRNTKASEADIKLQNDLVSDTATLKILQNYLTFQYVDAVKMAGDIDFAVKEAAAVGAFYNGNKAQVEGLNNYGKFLSSARPDFLLALSAFKDPANTDPALLRNLLNQSNNLIAQKNFRNRSVLDFVDQIDAFLKSDKKADYTGLKRAHDLLTLNEINSSLLINDKVLLKYFNKKALQSDYKSLKWIDHQSMKDAMQQDVENLKSCFDAEKLQIADAEKLGVMDAEKLGTIRDAEKLGALDAEKLGLVGDAQKLGIVIEDAEKMGVFLYDAEKLGQLLDSSKLGAGVLDTEKMGLIHDSEKLGTVLDSEKLGTFLDSEKLGYVI